MPQIWCSDNTDAIERLQIQYGTSFGYPISSMGSHVSVSPNLQTGRNTSIQTRAITAMAGSFGYELDVRKLNEEERGAIKEQIREFQQMYPLIHYGDYYRLTNAQQDREFTAWQFVDETKSEALVFIVMLRARSNSPFFRLRLRGLKEDGFYRINEGGEKVYEGRALMHGGILLPVVKGDYQSMKFWIRSV